MTPRSGRQEFAADRITEFLNILEHMAAGDMRRRLRISDKHDELDAIAHGVNVLVGELEWMTARAVQEHAERATMAERANVSQTTFFRNMSHEIRTPIAAMLGFADLLASDALDNEKRAELLRRLQANGQAVLSLLDDLLDLARLDAHRVVLTPEPVSVIELVHEVFASVAVDGHAKGLDMRVESAPGTFGVIQTDRYRLRQILVNLIANAVKFTGAGRIVVSLNAKRDRISEEWTIDVSDTGIGIPADRHPYLFEPFEQVSDSIVRVYGGSGLGLALSRRVADQLGGSLELLRSAPGEGTVFRLTLRPMPSAQMPAPAPLPAESQEGPSCIDGLRILVAEDHRDLHFAIRQLLEQSGALVESAYDGHEAVAKAMADPYDVVLMDLRMPRLDGLQATRSLRSQGCGVPIVALTADPATVRRAEAMDAGCDAVFSKPFELEDLMASVRQSPRWNGTTNNQTIGQQNN